MISFFKKLLGIEAAPDYKELIQNGAIIVDVRTEGEYQSGHIKGSKNIPLNHLQKSSKTLSKDKAIITCCASGMRSASAKSMLKAQGFTQVYNGGGWLNLKNKL